METIEQTVPIKVSTQRRSNVLVIEDDTDAAEAISILLADEGYGVRTVNDRGAALEAMRMNLYSVALMDLFMPGMSDQEFVAMARGISPRTKIVLMTAGLRKASTRAQELGLNHWLGKPFTTDELFEMLKSG